MVIIKFDPTRKKPKSVSPEKSKGCDHKEVIAYTFYRTVYCTACGAQLNPFDVLVDMLKSYVPPNKNDLEEKQLNKEVGRRNKVKLKLKKNKLTPQ